MNTTKQKVTKTILKGASPPFLSGGVKGNQPLCLYFDGCSKGNPGRAGAGAALFDNGKQIHSHSKFVGEYETNNVAEYTGLIIGLTTAIDLDIKNLLVKGDSLLVIKQMTGEYQVKSASLYRLFINAKALEKQFDKVTYEHIYRKDNKIADMLANGALGDSECE